MNEVPKLESNELPRYKVVVEYAFDYGEDYPTQRGKEEVIVKAATKDDAKKIANDQVYKKWRYFQGTIEHISDDHTNVLSCELSPDKE